MDFEELNQELVRSSHEGIQSHLIAHPFEPEVSSYFGISEFAKLPSTAGEWVLGSEQDNESG